MPRPARGVLAALVALCLVGPLGPLGPARAQQPAPAAEAGPEAGADEEDPGPSKKALFLKEKAGRKGGRAAAPAQAEPVLSVRNLWTGEVLPLSPRDPRPETWNRFLRCHHTNQSAEMDRRLVSLLRAAAQRFHARAVEVVSGFRSPKYNLMLRKKGHQVARESQHTHGQAIDFRIAGVQVKLLRRFVLAQRLGGVGYYPRSGFVHADTGPVRTWTAD
jgi:hypothetical protein